MELKLFSKSTLLLGFMGIVSIGCGGPTASQIDREGNNLKNAFSSTFASPFEEPSVSIGDTLQPGSRLQTGQRLISSNLEFELKLQNDGNLVLYRQNGSVEWHTNTMGQPVGSLEMQSDGNLVLYTDHRAPLYHSATNGNPGASLVLTNDGKLVVKINNRELVTLNSRSQAPVEENTEEKVQEAPSRRLELRAGMSLRPGEFIESEDGKCRLVFQGDGNIVAYNGSVPVYDTQTRASNPTTLVLQNDGNLVAYESNPTLKPYWASNTNGGSSITLSNTCRLEMKSAKNHLIWNYPINFR